MINFEEERRRIVEYLIDNGVVTNPLVIKALLTVPREEFVPPSFRDYAYVDHPLPIGYGQTISAIHMVAMMTEALDPQKGDRVLEVGTGSGYQAAVLAEIVARDDSSGRGRVYTIERVKELCDYALENLRRTGYDKYVEVINGDGTLGYPEKAPYDKIIVTAAAPEVPKPLIHQLSVDGKLVIPVGNRFFQRLLILEKRESGIFKKWSIECVFVPLIGEYGWRE